MGKENTHPSISNININNNNNNKKSDDLKISKKTLQDHIDILVEKLRYAERHRDMLEDETDAAIRRVSNYKRDLDKAMDEMRRLERYATSH